MRPSADRSLYRIDHRGKRARTDINTRRDGFNGRVLHGRLRWQQALGACNDPAEGVCALPHSHGCAGTEGAAMEKGSKAEFDLHAFLANANGGREISTYRANQPVFSQGEPADSVFYVQEGKVKVTVLSEQGKEAIVAILGTGDLCGEGCLAGQKSPVPRMATIASLPSLEPVISAARDAWPGSPGAWPQPQPWRTPRSCG